MLTSRVGEARLVEIVLLVIAAEAATLIRARAPPARLAHLGAGAALALSLRSALLGGRMATRASCLALAFALHLADRAGR